MSHLNLDQIENYQEGLTPELDAHLATCARCQKQIAHASEMNRALGEMERVAPAPTFAARLERALAHEEHARRRIALSPRPQPVWTGLAALLAATLLLVFAFETVVAFQNSGALDFVSLFASRPDLLSMYPAESISALVESFPLLEFLLTLGSLFVAAVLAQQFVGARTRVMRNN